jgi:hypothetical protein
MPVPEMWLVGLETSIQSQILMIILRTSSRNSVPMDSMLSGGYPLLEIVHDLTFSAYISSGPIILLPEMYTILKHPGRISNAYSTTQRKLGCG